MKFKSAHKIDGLIAAAFTAYHADGSVNFEYIPKLVEHLIHQGVKGLFVCGTNGEGLSLTIAERKAIAKKYVEAVGKRISVIVHVGHTSIQDARELARHAEEVGADAISSVCAFYFKPATEDLLVASLAQIAGAASSLPFYYYHIPHITGVNISLASFIPKIATNASNFAGVKFTSSAIHEYQDGLQICADDFDMLFGFDELLLPALSVGARAAIGSTYNYAAPIYLQVMEYFKEKKIKEAQDLQYEAIKMIKLIVKYGPIPAQRAIMDMLGFSMGSARLPLGTLSLTQTGDLKKELEDARFFETLQRCINSLKK